MRRTDAQSAAVPIKISYFNGRVVLQLLIYLLAIFLPKEKWAIVQLVIAAVQCQIPGDAGQIGPQRAETFRRDGIPDTKVGVTDTLFRVPGVSQEPLGHTAAQRTIFLLGLGNGFLTPLKEQLNDLLVSHGG